MTASPIPEDELQRLAALRKLLLLNTAPEERFDRIVQFAAKRFDVPIALIGLVDHDRQWFKAKVGVEACETSREVSFCGHAILQRELLIVEDASADPRFCDNPMVSNEPHVRFYAGAPLHIGDIRSAIGTLCLVDVKPRSLDEGQRTELRALRDLVLEEMTSRCHR